MLKVLIPACEQYNELTNEFFTIPAQELVLEHSLVSISKWEMKWHKPFIDENPKTQLESEDYIKCMTLTQNVDPRVYANIPADIYKQISDYIDNPATATKFSKNNGPKSREIVTSELIYYWMVALNIPFECQKWHLNRLLTLIRVCNIKNAPAKKMSKSEIMAQNRALNESRKKKYNTKG